MLSTINDDVRCLLVAILVCIVDVEILLYAKRTKVKPLKIIRENER